MIQKTCSPSTTGHDCDAIDCGGDLRIGGRAGTSARSTSPADGGVYVTADGRVDVVEVARAISA